ncbi:uncharacterized protein LOC122510596 [Leptopilina heterotoma]|uniref:uncharacterized protein LOC122510596 n=1 Tax=Leptopilina heterotoma TaxID=63436 RepID=UPI001CA9E77D|nr:uncharacterized protein LOC122510596 [Leptopilina heterotoma]
MRRKFAQTSPRIYFNGSNALNFEVCFPYLFVPRRITWIRKKRKCKINGEIYKHCMSKNEKKTQHIFRRVQPPQNLKAVGNTTLPCFFKYTSIIERRKVILNYHALIKKLMTLSTSVAKMNNLKKKIPT